MINYYSILGIKADADAASIRAAYLQGIKQVHPDLPSASEGQAARVARELNEAYWVLKDEARRRAYDARLRRANWEKASRRLAPLTTTALVRRPAPAKRRLWPAALVLLPAIAVASGLAIGSAPQTQHKPVAWSPETAAHADDPLLEPDRNVWVDPVMVEHAVENASDLANGAGAGALLRYSRNCFAQLNASPSHLRAEHCIAFDLAAASILAVRTTHAQSEFEAPRLNRKHLAALRAVSAEEMDAENWLRAISEATISEMARHGGRRRIAARDD